jgi:hypothetical protein
MPHNTRSLDLESLSDFYKCFSVSGITYGMFGMISAAPSGALRENRMFDPPAVKCDEDPDGSRGGGEVLPSGEVIELHLGVGANFGNEEGCAMCLSSGKAPAGMSYR